MRKSVYGILAGASAFVLAACSGGEAEAPAAADEMVSEAAPAEEATAEAVEEVEATASDGTETIDDSSDPTSNPIGPG